jgi:hypothetical protein
VQSATSPIPWRRYIALGDPFTEGLSDPDPQRAGEYRGWADRWPATWPPRRTARWPPARPRPLAVAVAEEAAWVRGFVEPWVGRRLRGRSSGDGRAPERPVPLVLPRG